MRAEVFWYRTVNLAANALEPGDTNGPDWPDSLVVDLPDGLAEQLTAAAEAYAGLVDQVVNHLRATGQTKPSYPGVRGTQAKPASPETNTPKEN